MNGRDIDSDFFSEDLCCAFCLFSAPTPSSICGLVEVYKNGEAVAKRITIRFVGADSDGGDVRLSDFIDKLEAFKEALKQTERILSGDDRQSVYYKVVDLTHSSPATVTIEAVSNVKSKVSANRIMGGFVSGLRGIRSKSKPPANSDLASLEAYKKLGAQTSQYIEKIEVYEKPNNVIPIDTKFTETVDKIIGPDSFAYGTVSGRLERVNLHNSTTFDIFPTVGPPRIRCEFKKELKDKVRDALDRYVTVSGKMRYKQWDHYPYRIDALSIDRHQDNNALPTLDELRGLAKKVNEGMSAEELVRSIRNANW